jgi:hypothetical protein
MTLIVAVGAAAAVLAAITLAVPLKPLGRLLGAFAVALVVTWWLTHHWWVAEAIADGFFGMLLLSVYEWVTLSTQRAAAPQRVRRPAWPPR